MDRAYAAGAAVGAPTPPVSPSIGYPTPGNPATGIPATKPGPWWYYMITEEIRGIIAAAGLTPSQSDVTQLLQALPAALASRPEMAKSLLSSGYQKLPGGFILQWVSGTSDASGVMSVSWPLAFPTAILGGIANEAAPSGWGATSTTSWGFDLAASTLAIGIARVRNIAGTAGPSLNSGIAGRILAWGK